MDYLEDTFDLFLDTLVKGRKNIRLQISQEREAVEKEVDEILNQLEETQRSDSISYELVTELSKKVESIKMRFIKIEQMQMVMKEANPYPEFLD